MALHRIDYEDLTNKVYGDLTVISLGHTENRWKHWNCLCKCGKQISIRSYYLTHGLRKACSSCNKRRNNRHHYRDLTGLKFNDLEVLQISHYNIIEKEYYWRCLCGCSKEVIVNGSILKTNRAKSCGCLKKEICKIDINSVIGKKFNKLFVLENMGTIKHRRYFKCLCECGKKTIVYYGNLKKGTTKSCGCLRKERTIAALKDRILPNFEAGFNRIYSGYRNKNAMRRNLPFELTVEEFRELIKKNCYYCESPPSKSQDGYLYNGLDRVDNSKGYTMDNVVPCCNKCNMAKASMTQEVFFDWAKKLYENLKINKFIE